MSLRNIIEPKLISCSPDESIQDVAKRMGSEDVGAVLVLEDKKPIGIITDRDIVLRCVVGAKDCTNSTAESVMSRTVVTVDADDGIYDVIQAMKKTPCAVLQSWMRMEPPSDCSRSGTSCNCWEMR